MVIIKRLEDYLKMIKFSHSIFALPFAFTSAVIASDGLPDMRKAFWIIVAMVGGRSGAMGLNRIIDRKIDALNPRTWNREIPKGVVNVKDALFFTITSFLILLFVAYQLNPLCLKLFPVALAVLFLYSYTKRFTWLSHLVLGTALSLAPIGAWVAIKGTLDLEIVPLTLAVICWVSGFDIIYALQDLDFDKRFGLYSIPVRFGVGQALWFARLLHLLTILFLTSLIFIFNMHFVYMIGVALATGLLLYEHNLIKPDDLSHINVAFFNMNGYISITVFVFTLLSYL